ncbi:AMP-binding protein [Shigella sonnei]
MLKRTAAKLTGRKAATCGGTTWKASQRLAPAGRDDAEDPLFILYTSGSTGKPKACCTLPAVMVYAALPFKYVFDYHPGDIYGAPPMWLGYGHSYLLYGPLACGATTLMFEGVRTGRRLPVWLRWWTNIRLIFCIPHPRQFAR